jgi:cytosolic iron-sulfur protein assembly protein CIAO1
MEASDVRLGRLPDFQPRLLKRAWCSVPHPTLPLLATAHDKEVTVFSLATFSKHSALTGGHSRSVRSAAWKPGLPAHQLCVATGSFDSTAALWRWNGESEFEQRDVGDDNDDDDGKDGAGEDVMELEITRALGGNLRVESESNASESGKDEWELDLVLEGHESEIKCVAFSPSGQYLATCSRDKSVWIWEDVGASEGDDDWETVAVLNEHDADVKAVAWCPDLPNRTGRGRYSADVLASASYDDTIRVWREDGDGEWVCVAVLQGHEGTVWGLQWEPVPRSSGFPRILSFSADRTARIWTLQEDDDDEEDRDEIAGPGSVSQAGGIPNRMRRSMREEWRCSETLPKVHSRDIYSASWSAISGRIATTGSDGKLVVYAQEEATQQADMDALHQLDGELQSALADSGHHALVGQLKGDAAASGRDIRSHWRISSQIGAAHGAYEVNHVAWCRRWDRAATEKKVQEMLVTTGDDGYVRPWEVSPDISKT